ncbi:response regulator [Pseudohongiella spirulinae]|uniref:Chemotaxis protein CheC n=1 Tax=Pseudohongiella spirulinae TaxID=1249552 RepID=A0A0S2KCF9_9GAMM|nr:response regulator [Pseudohongiella spirulinae]ALO46008.1 chemotaxis protein CheC [Pseudohongiella spirulinae]
MTLPVLICDDSRLARRQMARSLPENWDVDLYFAENGAEAIDLIRQGKADLLFLDLNMPVMNGYEVLDIIRTEDLPTMVLVVSGDVQAEARQRVMSKGALDFIRKPVSREQVTDILQRYGIYDPQRPKSVQTRPYDVFEEEGLDFLESFREVINVAMGQAGSHLGELLGTFIQLPVPEVFMTSYSEIDHHLAYAEGDHLSAVSHGFSGNGIAGEGIVLLESSHIMDLKQLVAFDLPAGADSHAGILTDLSELLVGSCLKGISQQLDIDFNHSYPAILGHHQRCNELLDCDNNNQTVLAVNITYYLQNPAFDCHLLLVLTEDSVPALRSRVELINTGKD